MGAKNGSRAGYVKPSPDGGGASGHGRVGVPVGGTAPQVGPELAIAGTAEIGGASGDEGKDPGHGPLCGVRGSSNSTDVSELFGITSPVIDSINLVSPQPAPMSNGASIINSKIIATKDIRLVAGNFGVTAMHGEKPIVMYPFSAISRICYAVG